jgi:hypothetical protein
LEKEEESYKKSLFEFGIDIESDFAFFCLHTTEISFRGRIGSIDNICWFFNILNLCSENRGFTKQSGASKRIYSIG